MSVGTGLCVGVHRAVWLREGLLNSADLCRQQPEPCLQVGGSLFCRSCLTPGNTQASALLLPSVFGVSPLQRAKYSSETLILVKD